MSNPHLYTPTICPKCGHDLPEGLDRRSRIIELLRTRPDIGYRQVAWMFEVSRKTVSHYAMAVGIKRKRGGYGKGYVEVSIAPMICPHCRTVLPEQKRNMAADVVRYIKQHPELEYADIAQRFGVHERTVKRYARSGGVKRGRGGDRRKPMPGTLTTEDVMRMAQRSRDTIYVWRRKGLISATRLQDGTYVYDRASVEAHIKTLTSRTTPPL